jgi:hypothetical protein
MHLFNQDNVSSFYCVFIFPNETECFSHFFPMLLAIKDTNKPIKLQSEKNQSFKTFFPIFSKLLLFQNHEAICPGTYCNSIQNVLKGFLH